MGVSYYSSVVVGFEFKNLKATETIQEKDVTRYNNITGEPYIIKMKVANCKIGNAEFTCDDSSIKNTILELTYDDVEGGNPYIHNYFAGDNILGDSDIIVGVCISQSSDWGNRVNEFLLTDTKTQKKIDDFVAWMRTNFDINVPLSYFNILSSDC